MVRYIVHIADIHIRNEHRHEEYSQVFNDVIYHLQQYTESIIICVCGDILHQKEKVNGDVLWLARDFLHNLATIGQTIVIDGNHDIHDRGNDNISILRTICNNIPNLLYVERSSIITIDGITFGISCLYDELITRDKIGEQDDFKCIALGHFALRETGVHSSRTVPSAMFEGYGFALLGDIHEMQQIGNCYYSGSLIQQNHGESYKKGFGVVDLNTNKYKAVRVRNNYRFITITNDILPDTPFTLYTYLRLVNCTTNIEDKIKTLTEVLTIKRVNNLQYESLTNLHVVNRSNDYKSETDYFLREVNDKKMIELHNVVMKEIGDDIMTSTRRIWTIDTLEFKNILAFDKDKIHVINFDESGVIGIVGDNFSGKSSLMKILVYAICGTLDVSHTPIDLEGYNASTMSTNKNIHYKGVPLLNHSSKSGYTKVHITTNGIKYTIIRTMNPSTTKIFKNNIPYEDKKRDLERYISLNVTNFSSMFMMTNICSSNLYSTITSMSDHDRFVVFNNILGLNIFTSISLFIKHELYAYNEELKNYKKEEATLIGRINDRCSELIKDKLDTLKVQFTDKAHTDFNPNDFKRVDNFIQQHITLYNSIEPKYIPVTEICKLQSITDEIDLNAPYETPDIQEFLVNAELDTYSNFTLTQNTGEKYDKREMNDILKKYNLGRYTSNTPRLTQDRFTFLLNEVEDVSQYDKNELLRELKELMELPTATKVEPSVTEREVTEYLNTYNSAPYVSFHNYIGLPNDPKNVTKRQLIDAIYANSIEDKLVTYINTHKKSNMINIYKEYDNYYKNKRKKHVLHILDKIQYSKELSDEVNRRLTVCISNKLRKYLLYKQYYDRERLYTLLAGYKYHSKLYDPCKQTTSVTEYQIKVLEDELVQISTYEEELNKLTKEIRHTKRYIQLLEEYNLYMCMNGKINKIMITDKLNNISINVNKMISKYLDLQISFESDNKKGIQLLIQKNNKPVNIKCLSGFELFMIDICTKLCIIDESNGCITNMFMIDEGLDVIDENNWNNLSNILSLITDKYPILLMITHRKLPQKMYNRCIYVNNGDIL